MSAVNEQWALFLHLHADVYCQQMSAGYIWITHTHTHTHYSDESSKWLSYVIRFLTLNTYELIILHFKVLHFKTRLG